MIKIIQILLFVILSTLSFQSFAQQRFPKPEFETGYEQPETITPDPVSLGSEYFDVFVLLLVMSLAAWFTLKSRSRNGILLLSIFSLLYFGFYREGCICSIGSIQNIALSFFDSNYAVSIPVLAFFILPLFYTLFFGRVFCSSACPLGVIQDLIHIKSIEIPRWLQKTLGLFPYIYLGLAILFAVTGTDFIICRFDPFIGIFRMSASFLMIIMGISFLVISLFVGRPYCRFVCPYGVLLKWVSYFSKFHLTISASKCISCKLCTTSCPFDAIEYPTETDEKLDSPANIKKFTIYGLLIPVWMFILGYGISEAHFYLAKAHPDVYLADMLVSNPELMESTNNLDIQTFMESGKTLDQLVADSIIIQHQFYIGSWILGAFIGLIIGVMLMKQFVFRKRDIYEPNKGDCYSCARCIDYCPVQK